MKYTYILVVFIGALIFDFIGAFFKVVHFEVGPITGNVLLFIGMAAKVIAGIMLIIELLRKKKGWNFHGETKEFINNWLSNFQSKIITTVKLSENYR